MSGTTSVPQPAWTTRGFIAPTEAAIVAGTQADISAAFGGNLNTAGASPAGQVAASEAAIIGNKNDQFLFYTNQVDPAFAIGRMQDAIARIYFLDRDPAQPTAVQCNCVGVSGTVIPAGSLALATDGNLYQSLADATIPVGGTVSIAFACTVTGPIPCPAGSMNVIYRTVPGWNTITNPADGAIGVDVESRADFELRRQESVAANALGIIPAIQGNVLAVPNVLDAYVIDNSSASPVTIQGVTIAGHSLYVCVAGGDPTAVAGAIWLKKMPGCGMTGGTTVTIVDNNSGYSLPYPTYTIKFQTAATQAIKINVNITNSVDVPSNALTLIRNAIVAAFSGSDGGARARIGGTVYASRFYAPVAVLGPWADIIQIQVGTSSANANTVAIDIDTIPTINPTDISLTLT